MAPPGTLPAAAGRGGAGCGGPAGFGVGHVLELEVVGQVAQRPDPRHIRLIGVVGDHVPVFVGFDPGRSDVEPVAVGDPADCHQQRLALGRLGT